MVYIKGEILKTCKKCKTEKDLECYSKQKSAKDGLQTRCKECVKANSKAWYLANLEKAKADSKAWYLANPKKKTPRKVRTKKKAKPKVKAIKTSIEEKAVLLKKRRDIKMSNSEIVAFNEDDFAREKLVALKAYIARKRRIAEIQARDAKRKEMFKFEKKG